MEEILNRKVGYGVKSLFKAGSARTQDRNKEEIRLFQMRKSYFHFLLTTGICASVIESLMDTLQDGEVLAYFYCDFREEWSSSAAEVMRSLLSQLLRQFRRHAADPGDLIDQLVEERDEGGSTVSNVTFLAHHISRAAEQFQEAPFLVIDTPDECEDVEELLGGLVKLQEGGIRLLAVSRPLQNTKEKLSGIPLIDMEAMGYRISADIRLHVTRGLDSHRRLRIVDTSLKEEIYFALCKKAGGILWAGSDGSIVNLNTLKECMTASELREALNDLLSDLNVSYGRILLEINRAKREGKIVQRAPYWLVAALKPLQLSRIMEGLSIDLARRAVDHDSCPVHGAALLDSLGSLVTYDEVTDVVILSHFTVKQSQLAGSVDEQAAHTQLALLCLYYVGIYVRHHQKFDGDDAFPHDT
ncbi:hypothetical protein J3R83DRAFT_13687 [Lanmaoa asiatica]|nr:hypothetical protein J3R83DRAFT_13687 [Lanmaoa asiatica]